MNCNDDLFDNMKDLRGRWLGRPVFRDGLWIFGGGQKRPELLIEIGSYWSWSYYGGNVLDSLNLSETSATMGLLEFDTDAFKIGEVSWERGSFFSIVTVGHCCLDVRPKNNFDPTGHMSSPISVRVIHHGDCIYEDCK